MSSCSLTSTDTRVGFLFGTQQSFAILSLTPTRTLFVLGGQLTRIPTRGGFTFRTRFILLSPRREISGAHHSGRAYAVHQDNGGYSFVLDDERRARAVPQCVASAEKILNKRYVL